jgi:hypothetical protein
MKRKKLIRLQISFSIRPATKRRDAKTRIPHRTFFFFPSFRISHFAIRNILCPQRRRSSKGANSCRENNKADRFQVGSSIEY